MNWQIILGVICLIGGIGNLFQDFSAFLFGLAAGAILLYFGLAKRKGRFKAPVIDTDEYYLAYHYNDVKFYPPMDMVSKINKRLLNSGADIVLMQEPRNKYDNRAVALYISGRQIGYLLRGTLQDMANDYIEKKLPIKATLRSIMFDGSEYQGYIDLSFYKRTADMPKKRLGYTDIDIHSILPSNPDSIRNTPLTGKNIVFSGYFSVPIDEVMQIAVDAGAILKTRVTRNTDYLVVGTQDQSFLDENGLSSKEATATKLIQLGEADIKIIGEKKFLELAQNPVCTERHPPLDDLINYAKASAPQTAPNKVKPFSGRTIEHERKNTPGFEAEH